MAGINLANPFTRDGAFPIDEKMNMSKAEMLAVNDNTMPEKYFTICKDDGQLYLYNKSNAVDSETGKFRLLEGGSDINDITEQDIDNMMYGG